MEQEQVKGCCWRRDAGNVLRISYHLPAWVVVHLVKIKKKNEKIVLLLPLTLLLEFFISSPYQLYDNAKSHFDIDLLQQSSVGQYEIHSKLLEHKMVCSQRYAGNFSLVKHGLIGQIS